MNTLEKLDRLYETYERFDYNYLLTLAKEKAGYIFRMVRSRKGSADATNLLVAYSSLLAICNFNVSEDVYKFFTSATGINTLSYKEFVLLGKKLIGDLDVKMMFRETSRELDLPTEFDNALFLYALVFAACDGKINDHERRFILEFVPFGDCV